MKTRIFLFLLCLSVKCFCSTTTRINLEITAETLPLLPENGKMVVQLWKEEIESKSATISWEEMPQPMVAFMSGVDMDVPNNFTRVMITFVDAMNNIVRTFPDLLSPETFLTSPFIHLKIFPTEAGAFELAHLEGNDARSAFSFVDDSDDEEEELESRPAIASIKTQPLRPFEGG